MQWDRKVVVRFWNEVSIVTGSLNTVIDHHCYLCAYYMVVLQFVRCWSRSHQWISQQWIVREAVWLRQIFMFNGQWNMVGRCVPKAVDSQLQVHLSMRNCWFIAWQTPPFHVVSLVNRYSPLFSWHAQWSWASIPGKGGKWVQWMHLCY